MPVQFLFQKLKLPQAKTLPFYYHRLLCKIIGIDVVIKGAPPTRGLIIANHISWTDIPALSATCPLSFIAKREVSQWPFFGWLANLQGCEFINRNSKLNTKLSANRLKQRLANNETLVLFPEGTSGNGRRLLPFKSAYCSVVENTEIPVTTATLIYSTCQGLPLSQRQWYNVSWTGEQSLLPNLWNMLSHSPLKVEVIFRSLGNEGSRKSLARAAEDIIRATLHGGVN